MTMRRKKQKLKRYRMQAFLTLDSKRQRAEMSRVLNDMAEMMYKKDLPPNVSRKLHSHKEDVEDLNKILKDLEASAQRLLTTEEVTVLMMKALRGQYLMMTICRTLDSLTAYATPPPY